MVTKPRSLIFLLILSFVSHTQGLHLSMDTTADSTYCAHLFCWAHKSFTDKNILTVFSLSVYEVTNSNEPTKLASLSVYDPDVFVDPTKINDINVVGHITWNSAGLTLALSNNSDCVSGTFICELDFVDIDSKLDKIRETLTPGSSGNCLVVNEIVQGITQMEADVGELKKENNQCQKDNDELKKENDELKKELDKCQHSRITCTRGEKHSNAREKFLLWDKVPALCDTVTDGGGWIVIQRRTKGDVDFYKGWDDYKKGFGTPDIDFWIGLEIIYNLTSQGYTELRIDMEYRGQQYFAHYSLFSVSDETSNYRLHVSGYNGTKGDSLTYHNGMEFSTYDRDHDNSSSSCAVRFHGAWWYKACYHSNLNGPWGSQTVSGGVWQGIAPLNSHIITEMKIRLV